MLYKTSTAFRKCLFPIVISILSDTTVLGQDAEQLNNQISGMSTDILNTGSGLIGGFSLWGLIGGFLFGGIGFAAFVYGKKNSALRPLVIGLLLMFYPYFIRTTAALYIVGAVLTAALYFFRE